MGTTRHTSLSGFTLIELLVVIAIIGILSSVVLASLNTARQKGADAAVKSNLSNAPAQAELFYDDNGNRYVVSPGGASDVCASAGVANGTKGIYQFAQGAASASGKSLNVAINTTGTLNTVTCHATPSSGSYFPFNAWAMEAPLNGTYPGITHPMYCIDSSGVASVKDGSSLASGDATCS